MAKPEKDFRFKCNSGLNYVSLYVYPFRVSFTVDRLNDTNALNK